MNVKTETESDEQTAEEAMDTGTLEHMKDITEKENPADDKKKIENEENTQPIWMKTWSEATDCV